MMRTRVSVAPRVVVQPRVVYYPPYYYPRTYSSAYMPAYGYMPSYGGYGSYQMPYPGAYSSNSYGSGYGADSSSSYSATQVVVYDNYFQPNQITVPVGTTVRWTNSGHHQHTITSDTDLWDSGKLSPGEGYGHTFTAPGTYPYHCTVHAKEMRGVVIVK
jgi:plastocyanin